MKRHLSVPVVFGTVVIAVFLVYVGFHIYALGSDGPWIPGALHYTFVVALAVAAVSSVIAEAARWLNEQGELRAGLAQRRAEWIDGRAEQRHQRKPGWYVEPTTPNRIIWTPRMTYTPGQHRDPRLARDDEPQEPASVLVDTVEWNPTAAELERYFNDPDTTGDIRKDN